MQVSVIAAVSTHRLSGDLERGAARGGESKSELILFDPAQEKTAHIEQMLSAHLGKHGMQDYDTSFSLARLYNDAARRARGEHLLLIGPEVGREASSQPVRIRGLVRRMANDATLGAIVGGSSASLPSSTLLVRRALWAALDGFDPLFEQFPSMELDLCLRARSLGHRVEGARLEAPGVASWEAAFSQRWVPERRTEALRTPVLGRAPRGKLVTYTAISNHYDDLKMPSRRVRLGADFVALLDAATRRATGRVEGWQTRPLRRSSPDPIRVAKLPKILAHRFFPTHQFSLWVDGSIEIVSPFAVRHMIALYLRDADLCLFRHHARSCTYDEEAFWLARDREERQLIRAQMRRYREEGFPVGAGYVSGTVILRRHSPAVRRFNEIWWDEIRSGSRRDQLSLLYAARKSGVRLRFFPLDVLRPNGLFRWHPHRVARR